MTEIEMYKCLNKGIPNYIPIYLDIETLINECSSDSNALTARLKEVGNEHQKRIARLTGMTKYERYFFKQFRIWTNHGTSTTSIFINHETLLEELKNILGVKGKYTSYEELLLALKERIMHLFDIKTPEALQSEYPIIYQDYLLAISAERKINRLTPVKPKDVIREQWRFFDMYGLNSNFNQFMNRQRIMYGNLVAKSRIIEIETKTTPVSLSVFEGLDKDKFGLYLAYKYLKFARNTDNIQQKQECIYYLCSYIRETKYTPVTISIEDGVKITFDKIVSGYQQLFRKNIELRPIDDDREKYVGLHISVVKDYVRRNFMKAINWHIVPKGKRVKVNDKVIDSLNRKYNHLTPEEKEAIITEAYALYQRKMDFFESSNYVAKAYGNGQFNGYMAFFYENGEVLMEKFFDDYAESIPTRHEAIYNLKIADFETLSKLNKIVLMRDTRCRRITHTKRWEEKAKRIIETEPSEETRSEVRKVLTKLKLHN